LKFRGNPFDILRGQVYFFVLVAIVPVCSCAATAVNTPRPFSKLLFVAGQKTLHVVVVRRVTVRGGIKQFVVVVVVVVVVIAILAAALAVVILAVVKGVGKSVVLLLVPERVVAKPLG